MDVILEFVGYLAVGVLAYVILFIGAAIEKLVRKNK